MTRTRYHEIISWLRETIAGTRWEGHLFAVGGCCRDYVQGAEIKDIDLAVDIPGGGVDFARWLQSKGLLTQRPVLFQKFGTARIVTKAFPEEEIELVQTRREKYTKETSRCPKVVAGTIEEDCFRRDFTVNTLYYDISRREDLDMTGHALQDIRRGVLRTPLNPDTTFDDDPVRILRCLRFASRFGWDIEPETFAALCRNIPRLEIVSRERFHTEISKMLAGANPYDALTRLDHTGAIRYANPLIAEFIDASRPEGKIPGEWQHGIERLRNLENLPPERRQIPIALALIFAGLGKMRTKIVDRRGNIRFPNYETLGSNQLKRMLRSMKFEPDVCADVSFLVSRQNVCQPWGKNAEELTDKALRNLQQDCACPERLSLLLDFLSALNPGSEACLSRIAKRSSELTEEGSDGFAAPEAQAENGHQQHQRTRGRSRNARNRRRPWRKRNRSNNHISSK